MNITEDFEIGKLVYSAMAFDPDYASNGQLTYELLSSDQQSLSHFSLESSNSGDIIAIDTFDYDMGQTSFGMIVSHCNFYIH